MQKEKDKPSYYSSINTSVQPTDYLNCIKTTKKDNITNDNIHQSMLAQIPNVSINLSKIILERYKTIFKLKEEIDADPTCLNDIVQTTNGKSRKISSLAIKNILHYLS